jgi:hypothetical protein
MEWLARDFSRADPSAVEKMNVEPRHDPLGECGWTRRQRNQARWILGLNRLEQSAGEHQRASGRAPEPA